MTTAAVLRASVAPTMRSTPLLPVAVTCVLGCIPPLVAMRSDQLLAALVATTVVTSFGVGFALDDAAAATLEASPSTALTRRGMRVCLLLAILAVGSTLQLAAAAISVGLHGVPIGAWFVQDAAFVAVTLAVSAGAQWLLAERTGGAAAAPTALLLLFVVGALAHVRPWLSPIPGAPHWNRWGYLLAAATAALVGLSRDPASPRCLALRHASPNRRPTHAA